MHKPHQFIAQQLIETLQRRKETLATAESCTGGMLSEWLTQVPGSSSVFQGGIIAYDNKIKIHHLKVPANILEKNGAVSEPTAFYMAKGIRQSFKTTWGISITGIAGPDGATPSKPVGTICFGIAGTNEILTKQVFLRDLGRQKNREQAALLALNWLIQHIKAA